MTPKRIRILRVNEKAVLGGEQTDMLYLLADLDRARYEQTACSEPAGPYVDEVGRLGISHIPVVMRNRFDLAAVVRMMRIIRSGHYDLVHLHGARAGLLGRIAARLARAPLIVWTMTVFQADVLQGWRRVERPSYRLVEAGLARGFCDHIITVSDNLRNRAMTLQRVPSGKITTVYSAVDLEPYDHLPDRAAKRREFDLPLDAPIVCTVGRLCSQKGWPDFLQAAALLHARRPDVRFLVVGDGPMLAELEASAARLGLSDCVTFTGYRADVAGILAAGDVFATATHWESFCKVNVEAMAAAKPLVSTNVGAIPEVVGDCRGAILVPPHDPEAFADALHTVLDNLEEYTRWAEDGRRRAYERYSRPAMAERTSALYERLLAARPAGHVWIAPVSDSQDR